MIEWCDMLTVISYIALTIGLMCSLIIIFDIVKHPQMMKIMNVVWPINGWFFGQIALWTYFKWESLEAVNNTSDAHRKMPARVLVTPSQYSAVCAIGDAIGLPIGALTGMAIIGSTLFAHYIVEFILAYLVGIIFQSYAIYP